jgi:hypothetical protein
LLIEIEQFGRVGRVKALFHRRPTAAIVDLFRVHTDDRIMATDEAPDLIVEVPKLRIAIGMLGAPDRLHVRRQRVAQLSQAAT